MKVIGATAHYVTSELDNGPIIEQTTGRIDHSVDPSRIAAMTRDLECLALRRGAVARRAPRATQRPEDGRLRLKERP